MCHLEENTFLGRFILIIEKIRERSTVISKRENELTKCNKSREWKGIEW